MHIRELRVYRRLNYSHAKTRKRNNLGPQSTHQVSGLMTEFMAYKWSMDLGGEFCQFQRRCDTRPAVISYETAKIEGLCPGQSSDPATLYRATKIDLTCSVGGTDSHRT